MHHPLLRCNCTVQRERPGYRGDRCRSSDLACATTQVQEHHHSQQHREVHRLVLVREDKFLTSTLVVPVLIDSINAQDIQTS